MHTFSPVLTSSPSNANDGFNNSWIGVDNSVDRKMFAQVVYDINDTKGNYSTTSTPKIVNLDKTSVIIFKSNPDRKVLFLQKLHFSTKSDFLLSIIPKFFKFNELQNFKISKIIE